MTIASAGDGGDDAAFQQIKLIEVGSGTTDVSNVASLPEITLPEGAEIPRLKRKARLR